MNADDLGLVAAPSGALPLEGSSLTLLPAEQLTAHFPSRSFRVMFPCVSGHWHCYMCLSWVFLTTPRRQVARDSLILFYVFKLKTERKGGREERIEKERQRGREEEGEAEKKTAQCCSTTEEASLHRSPYGGWGDLTHGQVCTLPVSYLLPTPFLSFLVNVESFPTHLPSPSLSSVFSA